VGIELNSSGSNSHLRVDFKFPRHFRGKQIIVGVGVGAMPLYTSANSKLCWRGLWLRRDDRPLPCQLTFHLSLKAVFFACGRPISLPMYLFETESCDM